MAMWCHGIDSSANSQAFFKKNAMIFSFVSNIPKPSFVFVRLVGEVPEDVIELLHIFCNAPRFGLTCFSDRVSGRSCAKLRILSDPVLAEPSSVVRLLSSCARSGTEMHFFTNLLQGVCNLCNIIKSAAAAIPATLCDWAAGADLEGLQPAPLAMALVSAPLPCQMEPCFGTRLEPTRMRWKSDQVPTTVL